MSKRKELDAPDARAARKRKMGEEEIGFGNEESELDFSSFVDSGDGETNVDLLQLMPDDGDVDEGLQSAIDGGGFADDMDSELEDGLEHQGNSRQDSEVQESEPDDIGDLPFTEDELRTSSHLDFTGMTLKGATARRVAELIAENASLSTLQLNGHELPIGELSEEEELEWDSEEYTDLEAIIIAEILKKDTSVVKRLDLARNQVTDDGAKALADMLERNSTLEYLNLESNMVSEKGGAAFGRAVESNSTLQYLNLMYNSIPSTWQQHLRDSWQLASSRGQLGLHL